jgi:hypothetical protein
LAEPVRAHRGRLFGRLQGGQITVVGQGGHGLDGQLRLARGDPRARGGRGRGQHRVGATTELQIDQRLGLLEDVHREDGVARGDDPMAGLHGHGLVTTQQAYRALVQADRAAISLDVDREHRADDLDLRVGGDHGEPGGRGPRLHTR